MFLMSQIHYQHFNYDAASKDSMTYYIYIQLFYFHSILIWPAHEIRAVEGLGTPKSETYHADSRRANN